jgi:cephalosporin hydroxylase
MSWTQIRGWLHVAEGAELQRLAAGRTVLEIGALFGRSTVCLAEVARLVHSIDPHDAATVPGQWHGLDTLAECRANVHAAGLSERVVISVAPIERISELLLPIYDGVFVDGDHAYESCLRDLRLAATLARHWIAVHDYRSGVSRHDGVIHAVNDWAGGRPIRRVRSLAVLEF